MLVATLLLPVIVILVVLAVERLAWPAWLALMAASLCYGVLAGRQLQSYGRAFSVGFATAIEQAGLLLVLGSLIAMALRCRPLPAVWAGAAGITAGLTTSAAGGLALVLAAGTTVPRRGLLLLLLTLAAQALLLPSPVATAATSVLRAHLGHALLLALPLIALTVGAAWLLLRRKLEPDATDGEVSKIWVIGAVLLGLLVIHALAQVPSEPLGSKAANLFYTNLGRPFVVTTIGLVLLLAVTRRQLVSGLSEARWAPILLTVGASGGLSFVLSETGVPELLAEAVMSPRLGLAAPFLAAAAVKTMQGASLTAVLTAIGMTEPMLAGLGLDSPSGRLLAAAAAGAGSIAVCHVNDPLFWIGAHMMGLKPGQAVAVISTGSVLLALAMLAGLLALQLVL